MKKLDDLFNLSPQEEVEENEDQPVEEYVESTPINPVSMEERIDHALTIIEDLNDHDAEMDDIAKTALEAYEEIKEFGMNSSDVHAGKILEVASQMLKTAMDANTSKAKRRLDTLTLQLKKLKIDRDSKQETEQGTGSSFDRNELLKHLIDKDKE